jgi:hypothetical protein
MSSANNASASITIGGVSGFQSIKTDSGITNKVVLNNFSEITDLITLNNSNINEHSNVTINFDNKYRLGIVNSNLQILKYNEIINDNDTLINISDSNIIINNSNIITNFDDTYVIKNNDKNIFLIDSHSCNLDIMNYDLNYYITSNSFNVYDINNSNTNTSNTVIFGVESNKISINCDLIVGKIITKNIDSIDGKGINISSYQIEQNNFKKVSVGFDNYFTSNLYSSDELEEIPIDLREETNVPDAPFRIVNNSSNTNTSNLFEISKIYDNTDEKILKIDNYGYIYMGNCKYNDKDSYITINNSNYDNFLNINNDLKNYVSYSGDYYSDDFKINKYANVSIGSNIHENAGLLDINRNDNRINLDINNSNNINEDKPLLNLNLEYKVNNNYKWYVRNISIPYFTIFPSKEENIEYDIQTNNYNYIDNYKLIFGLNDAHYEKWKISGTKIPINGVLINNDSLQSKLKEKYDNGEELIFTSNEWEQFNINNLNMKDYVLIDGNIYQPKEKKLDNNEMFYHVDGHKYYFLHGNYVNAKLNYDYKKLNLQIVNNFNEKSTGVFSYDKSQTYNVLYNYYNLQYETEQIEYNFKTYYWKTDFSYHIFYPYSIIDNTKDGKEYIIEIDNITAAIPTRIQAKQSELLLGDDAIEYKYQHLFIYPTIPNSPFYTDDEKRERITFISKTNTIRDNLIDNLATNTDMYTSNLFNLENSDIENTTYYQYFQNYTSIRHIEVKATGLKWKKIILSADENINDKIDSVWDTNTISNKMNYANLHPYNIEMQHFQHSSKDSLLDLLRTTYNELNLQDPDTDIESFNITQNIWNTFNIENLYCNEYIYDDTNNSYYIPDEKIKVVFAIHFPLEFYNEFTASVQAINDYTSNIIEKPNFINLSSNDTTILNINNEGTLIYDYNEFDNNSNYSIYAPNKNMSTNKIQLNEIYSSSNSVNFNNLYLNNIAGIVFNTKQEFDVSQLRVDKISNNNNNLLFDNTQFNLNTIIYGLRWKLVNYSSIIDIDSYTLINSPEFLGMFRDLINANPNDNEYEIDYDNLSILLKDYVKNNIPFKSYIVLDSNNEQKYYIQNSNEYNYSSNFLLYDSDNIVNYEHLFYNNIISINTNNDNNIKPALTIYGNNPSFNLKSDKNSTILYQQSVLQKGFKKLSTAGVEDSVVSCDVFQINYYDDNNVLFDNNMYTNNSKHIIEHILGDYNILSFGENYNICIDTKGVAEPTFTDQNFGTIWVVDEYATTRISVEYENAIIEIFNLDPNNYEKDRIVIEKAFFETVGATDLHEDNYVLYNSKRFKPYITTYSYNLARNSTNKNHKISLGVPHNNPNINTAVTDADSGLYLYNYPKYFNEIIKNNDYMLNIYGNTKIYGVDGDTNALSININDVKSEDNTYKVNLGIATNPFINNNSNTLSIDGTIYAENLFYKEDDTYINVIDIYSNVINEFKENLFNEELSKSYIHTSNINSNFVDDVGIFNLSLIPKIPLGNFSTPELPTKEIYLKDYSHPEITSSRIVNGNNIITNIDLQSQNYKTSTEVVYTDTEDLEKINIEYNKYFYFVLTNDYSEQESKLFKLKTNDQISADILIIGGGGGAGYVKPFLNWYEIQNPTVGTEYKNTHIETSLKNGSYIFQSDEYDTIKNSFKNSDDTTISDIDLFAEQFISNNDYIKVIIDDVTNNFKYFRTFDHGGGEGGDLSIIKNIIIDADNTVEIIVGSGGLAGNTTTKTESTSGTNSSILGFTMYGGINSSIFETNNDIHPEDASEIYNFFNIYDNLGFNNSETDPTKKYFAGDGNNLTLDNTLGGGGGDNQADAKESTGGGGGYFNGNWGNGADGLVIIRYKFNLKDVVVDTETIENPTNGLLQYNWQNNIWELNYEAIDVSNILIDTIYSNSNILYNNIDNFSNIINNTSNNIIDTIISSNEQIYDNITSITNTINDNDYNYSNYINLVYNNTNLIGAERIISNLINIDRIPKIPIAKFSNLDIDIIYSPKVNDSIIIDTNYYLSNINYTSLDTDNDNYQYAEYIIFKHNNTSDNVTQTIYNLQFQLNTNIDILIIGGGGGGAGNVSYSGGGGGGAYILAKNIDIELNKEYEIIVGNGGLENNNGHASSAFGLIANGGNSGTSQDVNGAYLKGIGGNGGIPNVANKFTEVTSEIIMSSGGNGGSIDATDSNNISYTLPNSGYASETFINDNDNRQYYWGGGGGFGTNSKINSQDDLPDGGEGGGGAGAFNSDNVSFKTTNGESYDNEELTLDSGDSSGLSGSINSGGGGGGANNGTGGRGGSGIVIIKINSNIKPDENKRKKAYVSYNFNLDRWEMNSLDLLNLDINIDDINQTIKNSSNEVIDYVNSLVQREEYEYIIVPSNIVTNDSIVNNAIYSYNIFGYNGKSSNLTPSDATLVPDSQGLIIIPQEGYTDPNNIYYKKLIHGNKFALNSITNSNIADNSISSDKLQGTISGDKLKNLSINYSDITGDINSHVKIINDSSSSDLINVSAFNNITVDIELLDLTGSYNFAGLANIISTDNLIKIPINKLNQTNIYLSNIDLSENYTGITYLISHTDDININIFDYIHVNSSNILNFGNADFKINNTILNGLIDKNYLENIYIHSSNLNTDTLTNTNVYLFGEEKISPNYINNLTLSANQIATGADFTSSLDVTLKLDGQTIDPALLSQIQITPQDISFIENSLRVELLTSYEDKNGNIIEDKLNPRLLSNLHITPSDLSNINDYSVKLSNVSIDTSLEKLNPNIISKLTISPSDISNINDYSVKLSNVIINTGETAEEKLNPNLIASITMTPNQFNSFGSFQSVKLEGLVDNSIDPDLINHNSVTINANHIKTGINPDTGNVFKLPENMIYNFPDNSIDPTLIPSNIVIYGSNIDVLSGNKLDSVKIEGDIKSSIIGNNVVITSTANIINDGYITGRVNIEAPINTSIIKNAVIHDGNNIVYTGTKIQRTEIFGELDSEFIGNAEIRINNDAAIIGESNFSGTTTIFGNLDSKYIQNAIIDLNDADTSLMDGTYITGDVTITGIVNSGHINPTNGVRIDIEDGQFNGSNLANESIPYTKLSSNLNLYVDEIKFSNGTSFTSAISDDLYSKFEVDSGFVSKIYYNTTLAPIFDNNLIKLLLYNGSILENYTLPIYKNSLNNLTISTYNSFNSLYNDKSIIEIKSNNNNANISIVSFNNTELDKIGNKLLWENVGGSYFKVNSERLSFVLNNTNNTFEVSSTSNFSYKPLYIPELIFADGTTMNTSAITMLNSENQLIMNNSESGYNYTDNQITGEGFIHCNGIHAEFDITAFSSTTKSDINLKKNINNLEYNNELLQLNPVTFNWRDKNKSNTSNVGFIAQEVEKILPCLVKDGLDNYKSVNYVSLIPYLVKHIQTLEERIKKLETKY